LYGLRDFKVKGKTLLATKDLDIQHLQGLTEMWRSDWNGEKWSSVDCLEGNRRTEHEQGNFEIDSDQRFIHEKRYWKISVASKICGENMFSELSAGQFEEITV
jgi:hypothetical protein